MRKTALIIAISAICLVIFADCRQSVSTRKNPEQSEASAGDESEMSESEKLWIDTVMFADGHSFGYSGDVSMWDGWYFDTIRVGDDIMLTYDSIGPARLKLGLITRNLIIDMGDPNAPDLIKHFLAPINGFQRFSKQYEVCIDSVFDEKYGLLKSLGYITFVIDYADSCLNNATEINRFISEMMEKSDNSKVNVPALTAFYIGHKTSNASEKEYSMADNMNRLCELAKDDIIEEWRTEDDLPYLGICARTIEIRAHIANSRFITFSIYDYDRTGTGHGMYTESFTSYDLEGRIELTNNDIFKPNTSDKVKMLLLETMAKDSKYSAWHPGVKTAKDIESIIEGWQSPDPILNGTEWEEPERESNFELPECALTNEGAVFSFQPYEIDCWAAGSYHFIVPYSKLMPYLSPKAKKLISILESK